MKDLSTHRVRELAVAADRDPRTVRRFLSGLPVRGVAAAAIERALAREERGGGALRRTALASDAAVWDVYETVTEPGPLGIPVHVEAIVAQGLPSLDEARRVARAVGRHMRIRERRVPAPPD